MKSMDYLYKNRYFSWIKKYPDFLVGGVFIAIFVFSFLGFNGAITNGYNFIDDHEMLIIDKNLRDFSFADVAVKFARNDLNIRFRPLYYLHRVTEIKILGVNFFALSLYTGLLATLSFSFIYFGARKIRFSMAEALLLVALTFVGAQMAIWWRLGPAETLGVFLLSASFFFMGKCVERKNYLLNNILFVFFLILASLCKEIFALTIPAFVFFKIWNEKNIFNITLGESIKNNYLLILPITVMFAELYIIKFVVGTNKIGYAGTTSSMNEFIIGVKSILFSQASLFSWVKIIGVLFVLYFSSFMFLKNNKKEYFHQSLKSFFAYFYFALLVILPSILMYAKSGMVERYLLPATLGLAVLVVGITHSTRYASFKFLMYIAIVIFISFSFITAKTNVTAFAVEEGDANEMLSAVKRYSNLNSKILFVADPVSRYEVSWSVKTYLSYYGLENFYVYPMEREYVNDFERGLRESWLNWFADKKINDINGAPDVIIIMDKMQSNLFFNQSGIPKKIYKNVIKKNERHSVYIKK